MPQIKVTLTEAADISVEEFFDEMDEHEREEMLDLLLERTENKSPTSRYFSDDTAFDLEARKLIGNRWRLSTEDEQTVLRITKKIL